jgi:VIT1/CCC1 family predicted Fe2+/Mn2+ transporter
MPHETKKKASALTHFAAIFIGGVIPVAGMLLLFASFWWVASYVEASAYNRITGSDVTTWEAMFVELRVQAEPQAPKAP